MNSSIVIMLIISIPVIMAGLYFVAKSKGRSWAWLLWGIHPVSGLLALLVLMTRPRLGAPAEGAAPKPKLGALNILGFVVLIIGALATASVVSQMVMGISGLGGHLVFGLVLVIGGLAMATRKKMLPNTALEPTAAAPSVSDVPSNPKVGGESTSASGGSGSALDRYPAHADTLVHEHR